MNQPVSTGTAEALAPGLQGIVADWSSDQRAFKNVPWGKAMMWIFLLSDTFIFSSFLISYMTVRISTRRPGPIRARSSACRSAARKSRSS